MTTIVLLYYTLFILLVSITAAAFCLSGYLISHRRLFAYACVGFIAYFLDVALVFQDDFLLRGVTSVAPDSVYFVGSQLPSIVTGLGILMAFWLCICDFFEVKSKPLIVVPGIAFVVGSLVVFFLTDSGPVGLFVFYGMRSLFMVWVLAFVGVCYMQSPDGAVRERLWRYRWFYVGAWVLVFAIVAENGVLMFVIDPALVSTGSVPFFPERNFAENILMMWFAGFVCVDCWKLFSLHFKTPPADNGDKSVAFIDNGLASYQDRYGLSAREVEVLREVLLGKDNQHIANDMSLALSTVKVHVHNILHKTGQSNRQDLMRDFRMRS